MATHLLKIDGRSLERLLTVQELHDKAVLIMEATLTTALLPQCTMATLTEAILGALTQMYTLAQPSTHQRMLPKFELMVPAVMVESERLSIQG